MCRKCFSTEPTEDLQTTILDDWLENSKEFIWVIESEGDELKDGSNFAIKTLDGKSQIIEKYCRFFLCNIVKNFISIALFFSYIIVD